MFRELGAILGNVVGTFMGIAIGPIAAALDCSEALVKEAVKAGCRTTDDVRKFLNGEW